MKISIITLHTVKNYGSVLQAYATQKKFEKMGCEVEIIDYWRRDNIDSGLLKQYLKDSDKWNRNFLTRTIFMAIKAPSVLKKIKIFNHFLKDRIRLTKRRYYSLEELKTDVPEADIYCTGSDQMWNSDWNSGIERPFFLEYAPEGKPCIS
jgi:hypothetical protein